MTKLERKSKCNEVYILYTPDNYSCTYKKMADLPLAHLEVVPDYEDHLHLILVLNFAILAIPFRRAH